MAVVMQINERSKAAKLFMEYAKTLPFVSIRKENKKFNAETEKIIHRKEQPLETAAKRLYEDYMTDKNLTLFTQLDCEDFYETR
jgi:hypothetical protein